MILSKRQIKQLQMAKKHKDSPPGVSMYFRSNWRTYLVLVVVGVASTVFFSWGGWPVASGFFAGLFIAMIARDLRWFEAMVKGWPLQREITNWERVDELLQHDKTAP